MPIIIIGICLFAAAAIGTTLGIQQRLNEREAIKHGREMPPRRGFAAAQDNWWNQRAANHEATSARLRERRDAGEYLTAWDRFLEGRNLARRKGLAVSGLKTDEQIARAARLHQDRLAKIDAGVDPDTGEELRARPKWMRTAARKIKSGAVAGFAITGALGRKTVDGTATGIGKLKGLRRRKNDVEDDLHPAPVAPEGDSVDTTFDTAPKDPASPAADPAPGQFAPGATDEVDTHSSPEEPDQGATSDTAVPASPEPAAAHPGSELAPDVQAAIANIDTVLANAPDQKGTTMTEVEIRNIPQANAFAKSVEKNLGELVTFSDDMTAYAAVVSEVAKAHERNQSACENASASAKSEGMGANVVAALDALGEEYKQTAVTSQALAETLRTQGAKVADHRTKLDAALKRLRAAINAQQTVSDTRAGVGLANLPKDKYLDAAA